MRILVAKNNGISWYFRCRLPYEMIGASSADYQVHVFEPTLADLDDDWDVCIFSELDSAYGEIFLNECKQRKIATIIDIDDDVFSLLPSMDAFGDFYHRGLAEPKDKLRFLIRNLRHADLLTVSTSTLQNVYSPINPNIKVVPNQIQLDNWSLEECFVKPENQIWIVWQGTYNHWDDFWVIKNSLIQILENYPFARLLIAGFPEVIHQFPSHSHEQIKLFPFSDNLIRVAKLCRSCDIGIAPLLDCKFNRAKSDLKVLQYGAVGICVVASSVCYSDTIINNETGMLVHNPDNWYSTLSNLIANPNKRDQLGQALRQYVQQYRTLSGNLACWMEVLQAASNIR